MSESHAEEMEKRKLASRHLLADLKSKPKKLKKVQTVVKPMPVADSYEMTEEEVKSSKENFFEANMDQWLEFLDPKFTLITQMRSLSLLEAKALLTACENKDPTIVEDLVSLQEETDAFLSMHGNEGFLKLSCRSPKDVTRESVLQTMDTEFSSFNEKLCALYRAQLGALKVHSFQEALEVFVKSERIRFDLALDLRFPDDFSLQFVMREWMDIPLKNEFRTFVYDGECVAVTQYFTQLYFPGLEEQKERVCQQILQFHDEVIRPLLEQWGVKHCVVDYVVGETDIHLLEINDFMRSTGTGLFDWDSDHDLLYGKAGFECRLRAEAPIIQPGDIDPLWRPIMFPDMR